MITQNTPTLSRWQQTPERQQKPVQDPTQRRYLALINTIPSALITVGSNNLITDWNQTAERLFGIAKEQVIGLPMTQVNIPWDADTVLPDIQACLGQGSGRLENIHFARPNGGSGLLEITTILLHDEELPGYVLLINDITERRKLEGQFTQTQKLKSIGQLASGIAHEINTPTQYIGDNLRFLKESYDELEKLLEAGQHLLAAARIGRVDENLLIETDALYQAVDMVYLRQEIPNAIQQSLEGVSRVTKIVQAIKQFSHPDSGEKVVINLNKAIESTINVSRHEWKYVAQIKTEFDPALPEVPCLPGEFNQAILNIILNAVHAIEAVCKKGNDSSGIITISTRTLKDWAEIRISDTGTGIPPHARPHIFDPFFTTKEIGKGTGQGLAIAYDVIVDKHQGTITFDTEEDKGTIFIIRLPLQVSED